MLPVYGNPDGFAGVGPTQMGTYLKKYDDNRKAAIKAGRQKFDGAMLQGDNFVRPDGEGGFNIVGTLDEQMLQEGLPQPGRKRTTGKKVGSHPTGNEDSIEVLRAEMAQSRAKYNKPAGSTPTRDKQAPADPYNTGATGTITGLSGGSISAPYSDEAFVGMLGEKYGIQLTNPFAGAPNPATPGHQDQIRLTNGEIDPNAPTNFNTKSNKPGIDTNPAADQTEVSGLEALRTLSPDDVHIPEGDLTESEKGMATSRRSARSAALLDYDGPGGIMGAMRAAEAADGYMKAGDQYRMLDKEGNFQQVTREGIEELKAGRATHEDLLSKHLADAPQKALDKVFETGNADVISSAFSNGDYSSPFEGDSGASSFPIPEEDTPMFGGTLQNYLERVKK